MKLTLVEVTDWVGLWRSTDYDATLVYEGHSLSARELARHVDTSEPFTLEVIDGEGKLIDESVGQTGGFDGFSLTEVRKQSR